MKRDYFGPKYPSKIRQITVTKEAYTIPKKLCVDFPELKMVYIASEAVMNEVQRKRIELEMKGGPMSDIEAYKPDNDAIPVFGFDQAVSSLSKGLELAEKLVLGKVGVPEGYDKYKVFAILLKGKELNIPPMQSLTSLYVVSGRVAMEAQLMLALIYRSKQFESVKFDEGDNSFTTTFKRKGHDPVVYKFTMDDAAKMQYTTKGGQLAPLIDKFNWEVYAKDYVPMAFYFWMC